MKRLLGIGLTIALLFLYGLAQAGGDVPNLVGTWAGSAVAHHANRGYVETAKSDSAKWTVTEQKGRVFKGNLEYMSKKGYTGKQNFSGVIAGDNKTLYLAVHGDPTFEIGELGPNNELTLYRIKTGPEAMALMKKLKKVK